MAKVTRGNVDATQLKDGARKGAADVVQMFGGGDTVATHVAVYDEDENVIDGGAGLPSAAGGASGGWFQEDPIGDMDNSNQHFDLSFIPSPLFAILELDGAVQKPGVDYTLNADGSIDYITATPDSSTDHHTIWYFRGGASASAVTGYAYKRAITIDHTKVPSGQINFPVLVAGTYLSLATVANGGKLHNSSGYDVVFCGSISGAAPLDFEIESYDPATGAVAFWVRLPAVSSSVDTTFYMFYSNSGISTFQGAVAATWDSAFACVYHCKETGTIDTIHDSTSHGLDLIKQNTSNRATTIAGKIDGAVTPDPNLALNGGYSASLASMPASSAAKTLECWFNFNGIFTNSNTFDNLIGLFGWGHRDHDGGTFGITWHNTATLHVDDSDATFFTRPAGCGIPFTGDSSWHQIVVTSASGNTAYSAVKMYLDGTLVTLSYTNGSIATYTGGGSDLRLGNLCGGGNGGFGGYLDECRISSSERSAGWIAAQYNSQASPSTFYSIGAEQAA